MPDGRSRRAADCSCDGDCDGAATTVRDGPGGKHGLETLFHQYGVDFYMCGHEHDYERMFDARISTARAAGDRQIGA
jgi:hypothetical protein